MSANSDFSPEIVYMEQKVIKLNPAFLKVTKSKPEPKTKKMKPKLKSLGEHKLKKKLMSRIHDFQVRAEQEEPDVKTNDIEDEIQVFDTEFDKSISFLKELAEKRRKKQTLKIKAETMKPNITQTQPNTIQSDVHKNVNQAIMVNTGNLSRETSESSQHEAKPEITIPKINVFPPNKMTTQRPTHNQTIKVRPPPPYTCLKNSASMKPTYRQWMTRNNKAANPQEPSIEIHPNPLEQSGESESKSTIDTSPNIRRQRLDEFKSQFQVKKRLPRKLRRKKMTTVKHKLGKSGRKVCVLIKNHQTRKQVQREYSALKQKKISEVRTYLKKHNLLKGGSVAPNDVLKATYEQAILAGDVNNNNSETLIHNYKSEDSK